MYDMILPHELLQFLTHNTLALSEGDAPLTLKSDSEKEINVWYSNECEINVFVEWIQIEGVTVCMWIGCMITVNLGKISVGNV